MTESDAVLVARSARIRFSKCAVKNGNDMTLYTYIVVVAAHHFSIRHLLANAIFGVVHHVLLAFPLLRLWWLQIAKR